MSNIDVFFFSEIDLLTFGYKRGFNFAFVERETLFYGIVITAVTMSNYDRTVFINDRTVSFIPDLRILENSHIFVTEVSN